MDHRSEIPGTPERPPATETETETGAPDREQELRAFLRARLPDHMVPSAFVFLDAIPLTASGKVDRRALPAPEFGAAGTGHVAPQGEVEQQVAAICAAVLGVPRVSADDNFFELGGHSLMVTRVTSRLRGELGVEVSVRLFFEQPTVRGVASAIEAMRRARAEARPADADTRSAPAASDGELWRLSAGTPGRRPLFLVPGAGGGASVFAHLARRLGDSPVYGISAPEHQASLEDLAASYVRAIRGVQPHGPYVVGGMSLGGVIAFEMARQLERAGEPLALLVLLDSFAAIGAEPVDERAALAEFARAFGVPWQDLPLDPERVVALGGTARWEYVLACAQRAGVPLPAFEGPAQLARLFARFAGLMRMQAGYAPTPVAAPTLLVTASGDSAGLAHGWRPLVSGPLTVVPVAADHYRMLELPEVAELAQLLRARLAVVDA